MLKRIAQLPELWITSAMFALTLAIGLIIGVPFSLPEGDRAAFVGIHYLYPLIGVGVWGLFALFGLRKQLASAIFVALPCYALMMVCHFNLKLWRPLINPTNWDWLYWKADQALHPVVSSAMWLREAMFPLIPADSNLYLTAFVTMFYISFCYHAMRATESFRTLFLGALIFQALGSIAYLIMPALGPFLYETGVETMQTTAQQGMLSIYHELVRGGPEWVAANGGTHITVGLAAMPSLHSGGSFLFLIFAWRYAKVLVPLYLGLTGFILIDAIANRWHYVVDLPVGIALAFASVWLAERLTRTTGDATLATKPSEPATVPAVN